MSARAVLLYDGDCGFCRWGVGQVLRRDDGRKLRPVPIQSAEGGDLLAKLPPEQRLASWHLLLADGALRSAGDVVPPLLQLFGHPVAAGLAARAGGAVGRCYRTVANRRGRLGQLISRNALRRADALIAERSAETGTDSPGGREPPDAPEPPEARIEVVEPPEATEYAPPAPVPPALPTSLQQRLEESAFGRGVLSTLIAVTLIAIIAVNLPESKLRRELMRPGQPYLNALGLDQSWALFAPDPRRVVIDVTAAVRYDDGQAASWHFPRDGALIGTYRDYRWRKWAENLINPLNGAAMWRSAALWAAARSSRPGHAVASVALVEQFAPLEPPGVEPSTGPSQRRVVYVLRFTRTGTRA
jgi:predicted DCC family thiol-disulfide oxidoreductase YuxK